MTIKPIAATTRVFFFFLAMNFVALILYYERNLIIIERDEVYIYQYKGKEVKA